MDYEGLLITISILNSETFWVQRDNCALIVLYGNNHENQKIIRDLLFDYCKYNNQVLRSFEFENVNTNKNHVIIKNHKVPDQKTMRFVITERIDKIDN